MGIRDKRIFLFGVALAAIAVTASAAFACTNLATLNLSSPSGNVGDTVTLTGSSFRVPAGNAAPLPVILTWNGAAGPVLAQAIPDGAGNISATFTVPAGEPGYYVVMASHKDAEGKDTFGTPARAAFQILGPNSEAAVQPASNKAPPAISEPSSSGLIALTIGLGVLGLALFGAGFTAFVRQARRREVPSTAKVPTD